MTTATTAPASLFAKIAAVMGEVRHLEKTGRNQFDKYDYVTADAIASRIGSTMAAHKLALLPAIVSVETSEYRTKSGGSNFRTVVHMEMTLACGDTGAIFTLPWFGEAIDRSDKSISKATVSAVKYFLLKTFLLSGGDEDDADAESPSVEPQQTPVTRTQARTGQQRTSGSTTQRTAPPVQPDASLDGDVVFATGDDAPWYTVTRDNLTNGVAKFAAAALGYHRDGEPASAKQYQYLVGLLDSTIKQVAGVDDGHKRVLAVLCQADISSSNPPSKTLASKLLDKLATHKLVNGEKVENPAYDQSVVDAMIAIYRAAEAVATPQLFA